MDKIKIKEQEEKKLILIGQCPFCERKIRAINKIQLYWNLSLHLKQKHWNEAKADLLLKQFEEQGKIKTDKK